MPFTAKGTSELAMISEERVDLAREHFLCSVCGEQVTDERCALAAFSGCSACGARYGRCLHSDPVIDLVVQEDHGLMHSKCAVIAATLCPAFASHLTAYGMTTAAARALLRKIYQGSEAVPIPHRIAQPVAP